MTSREWANINGIEIPKTALSLVAVRKGELELIEDFPTPWEVPEKSRNSRRLHDVVIEICAVGACPTDSSGIQGIFPGEGHAYPYVPGHEGAGRIQAILTDETSRKLEERGMKVGDPVHFDINMGCGPKGGKNQGIEYICRSCDKGGPPFDCRGAAFSGVGSRAWAQTWYKSQTGREVPVPPGAYTEGFMVMPPENVYPLSRKFLTSKERWAMATQIDAIACAHSTMFAGNMNGYAEFRGFDNPDILVIGGAGRVTFNHLTVLRTIMPNANIYLADVDQKKLDVAAEQLNIPRERLYLITDRKDAYSRANLSKGFKGFREYDQFDIVLELAGNHAVDGTEYKRMIEEKTISPGSMWLTGAHTGYKRPIEMATFQMGIGSHGFALGISPRTFIRKRARIFLETHAADYAGTFIELEGGLRNQDLISIVREGGGPAKAKMDWGTCVTFVNPNPPTY